MAQPVTFQRIYADCNGAVHPATPAIVETVLRSMNQHAAGDDPFTVKFRFADGSVVVAKPKRRR